MNKKKVNIKKTFCATNQKSDFEEQSFDIVNNIKNTKDNILKNNTIPFKEQYTDNSINYEQLFKNDLNKFQNNYTINTNMNYINNIVAKSLIKSDLIQLTPCQDCNFIYSTVSLTGESCNKPQVQIDSYPIITEINQALSSIQGLIGETNSKFDGLEEQITELNQQMEAVYKELDMQFNEESMRSLGKMSDNLYSARLQQIEEFSQSTDGFYIEIPNMFVPLIYEGNSSF